MVAIIHCFMIHPLDYNILPNIMMEQKPKGYQGIRAIETLSTKIQEVTSNIVITKKNEKYRDTRDPGGISR